MKQGCRPILTFPRSYNVPHLHVDQTPTIAKVKLESDSKTLGEFLSQTEYSAISTQPELRTKSQILNPRYSQDDIFTKSHGVFTLPINSLRLDAFVSDRLSRGLSTLCKNLSPRSILNIAVPVSVQSSSEYPLNTIPRADIDVTSGYADQNTNSMPWLDRIRLPKQSELPEPVAVVDFQFDYEHPLFASGQFTPYENYDNKQYGVNPSAKLIGVKLLDFVDAASHGYHIFNLSLDIDFAADKIDRVSLEDNWEKSMLSFPDSLFVLSAGNNNQDLFRACSRYG